MGKQPGPLAVAAIAGAIGAAGILGMKLLKGRFTFEQLEACCVGTYGRDAPGIRIRFDLSPLQIHQEVEDIIAASERVHDQIAAVPLHQVTYERVIQPLALLEAEEFAHSQACELPAMVSPSKALRDASNDAQIALDAYHVKCSMREDVYRVVKAYAQLKEPLPPEQQRYVDRLVRDSERLGLSLDAATRAHVERLKTRAGELCITFQKHLNEDNTLLYFTRQQLLGMPPDFISSLKPKEAEKEGAGEGEGEGEGEPGLLEVSLKYRHYFPILTNCKVAATRAAMEEHFNKRCVEQNVGILEELVQVRHRTAQLLGYATHAHYVLAIRMAHSPQQVKAFLEQVSDKITPLAAAELNHLRSLKREMEGEGAFSMADLRFYMNVAQERSYAVDHQKLMEYFPLDTVTHGLLAIYQQLLGLEFREVPNPHAWHEDVRLFAVMDARSPPPQQQQLLGYFYLDLFPREGKYRHACVCPLQPGCRLPQGSRQVVVAALLANFTKPGGGKNDKQPSLLQHSEVETFFHEFGHVMHHICSRVEVARFSGTRMERDFVEAPSQMLEHWCWQMASLKLMSAHYQSGEAIPDDMCEKLLSSKKAHAGLLCKRQLLFGLFDQAIHTQPQADTGALLQELHPKIMMGIEMTKGTNLGASFGHLAGGYDASYYGYMWSEVFSADMFSTKFKHDVLDTSAGMEYRLKVLEPGGSKDAADILQDFLGRSPSEDAFLISKGLEM